MRNLKKRGQVKMFESVAVLIVFFFLLSFGFTFYGKMQEISHDKKIRKAVEIDTVNLAIKASNLPELGCSMSNVPSCYDEFKIDAFKKITANPSGQKFLIDHYYQLFDYSTITLNVIYPNPETILLYNRTRYEGKKGSSYMANLPISLYNPVDKTYKFAHLNIIYYVADA